jgi:hypothetical protein
MKLSRIFKLFIMAFVILVVAGFTYAYAATNTVGPSEAGDGSGTISGYAISAVHYNLNATTPSLIDSVTFTISASAATVKISLDGGTTYYSCSIAGTNVTCTTAGATVVSATSLRVIAGN